MELRRATEDDLRSLTEFAAALQVRPDRHIAFLAVDAASIAAEIVDEAADWAAQTAVAVDGAAIIGWLMGSVDLEMGRVWWWGPFVDADGPGDWRAIADALYDHARTLLPDGIDEEELGPDSRHVDLRNWALDRGFHADPGSAVLTLFNSADVAKPVEPAKPIREVTTRMAGAADASSLSALHDALFAGSHTTGASLATSADDPT